MRSAEERKRRAAALRLRRARVGAAALAAVAVLALGLESLVFRRPRTLSAATPVAMAGGQVRIPAGDLQQGKMRRYAIDLEGRRVRFLVLKTSGGVACALDACRLCGDRGYAQEGEQILCVNCDAEINPATFGQEGGCNPVPVASKEEGGALVIAAGALAEHASLFSVSGGRADPERACLVCGMKVAESRAVRETWQGRTYSFCPMPGCVAAFRRAPEKFARLAAR